jgi:hypothetical protein
MDGRCRMARDEWNVNAKVKVMSGPTREAIRFTKDP